jgi:hypothetical protein
MMPQKGDEFSSGGFDVGFIAWADPEVVTLTHCFAFRSYCDVQCS